MGSLTPPWADELLARKTKIARKMMSSMSTESYFEPSFDQQQQRNSPSPGPPNRFLSSDSDQSSSARSPTTSPSNHVISCNGESKKKVVDLTLSSPANARMASSQSTNSATSSTTSFSLPLPSSASARARRQQQQQPHSKNTEKLSPIRNESFVDEDEEGTKKSFEMTNGGEDLSILEYGPGIVKKLRSRYQSLALRQYSARPTLRRSASLENCLDAVSAEELAATLESKISNHNSNHLEDERNEGSNGRQHRGRNRFLNGSAPEADSRTGSPITGRSASEEKQQQNNEQNGKRSGGGDIGGGTPRGRTSGMDASARRDRMRRARSVDALHRTKREEEILEKFKHVVLPKEEIVIIEVSKPLPQEGSASVFNQAENGNNLGGATNGEKRFPTRLLLTSNNLRNSSAAASILDQQTANSVRNLMISPEHELPPHDIVRETARIFERNQENLNRRIGQALRLSKSQSLSSEVGSPPLVPPSSPTPSTTSNNTSQTKSVMAQSTTTSSSSSSPSSGSMQPSQDKSFPTKTSNNKVEANSVGHTNNAMANGPSHGQKQIGIIKPTLNNTSNGVINLNSKITNGGGSVSAGSENRVRSPILSPIGFLANHNKPLIQHTHKPPLSPKPIFTSSPKVNGPAVGLGGAKGKILPKESPSTSPSPILIIDNNRDRSVSPFTSDSPIPRVGGGDIGRVRSPVSSKVNETPPDSLEERRDAFLRSPSPANGKISPIANGDANTASKRLETSPTNPTVKSKVPEGKEPTREFVVLKAVPNSSLHNGQQHVNSTDHRQQISKTDIPPPPPRSTSPISTPAPVPAENGGSSNKQVSQLRVHQKKSNQGGHGSMVFNFTSRKAVPDYIEDDGIRRTSGGGGGNGRMDSMEDGFPSLDKDSVDSKLSIPSFEGGNVIINGRSSIQKRPKSQKLNISFNEEATTTHEYPSETSLLVEDDPSENENLSSKKPNVISGSSLGSYTPKAGSNAYQLGSYSPFDSSPSQITKNKSNGSKQDETDTDFIEDYLKPTTESTTWSNEITSDILF